MGNVTLFLLYDDDILFAKIINDAIGRIDKCNLIMYILKWDEKIVEVEIKSVKDGYIDLNIDMAKVISADCDLQESSYRQGHIIISLTYTIQVKVEQEVNMVC